MDRTWTAKIVRSMVAFATVLALASLTPAVRAQDPAASSPQEMLKQNVAAAKQVAADNQAAMQQYTWVERTTLSMKGEVKNTSLAQVGYDASGKLQKTPLTEPPPPPDKKRGLKGKAAEGKAEEMKAYMEQVKTLVGQYVPPSATRMQEAFAGGRAALSTPGANAVQIKFTDYVRPGDQMTLHMDTASKRIRQLDISSTLENKDPVTMKVEFQALPDGTNYAGVTTVDAPAKEVQVKVEEISFAKVAK